MRNQRLPPTTCSSSNNNTMQEDQPHLSGAYIRRLVKHLSSSSTKRSKDHHHHTITTMGTNPHVQPLQHQEQQAAPQTPPPPPPKKQVRRRLHTSRPYQERLLNMAEARREIVTALKIHRASMRQAKEQQLVQQQQEVQVVQEQIRQATWSAPMGSYGLSLSDYLHDSSPSVEFSGTSSSCSYYSSPILPYHTPPVAAPLVPMVDGPLDNFLSLPAQPLGLNLSFHGFGGAAAAGEDDKSDPTGSFNPPPLLLQASPASSYSVYSSPPPATTMASGPSHDVSSTVTSAAENTSLHRVLDDEEMAAICSAGEQHDMEWSDTVNLVTSAWWSTLLERVEGSGAGAAVAQQTNAGDAPLGMHRSDEYYGPDDSFQLPRMDIGEMDGWDAEWFS